MNLIPSAFTKRGFSHREIERRGDWRIYERKGHGKAHFEVVKITSHNGYTVAGVHIPSSEVYPSSSTWGIYGFTIPTLQSALQKLDDAAKGYP